MIVTCIVLLIVSAFYSSAQTTYVWTNGAGNAGSGNWQDANAWSNAGAWTSWADAGVPPHNIARFSATNASYTVTNNGTVIVGGLDFVKGPATLRGGTIQFGNNVTNKNNSSQEAKIYSVLSADPGVDVTFGVGNQHWSIYTNVNIPGKIIIDFGNVSYQFFLQADNVFTNTGDSIILQRARLDCRSASGQNLTNRTVVLGGGVIWVNTGTLELGDVRFDSLYTAGGTLSGNNKQINVRGRLIGNATNAVLSVSGANVDLYNPNVYTGGLALNIATAYSVTLLATNALPLNTVVINNGYLRLGTGSVSVVQELAGLAGTNGLVIGNASSVSTLIIVNTNIDYVYSGILGGGGTVSNNLALVKKGAASMTLSGINTYSGGTTISNGVLKLGSSGSIASSAVIRVESPGVFDVSALAGAYTVVSNQVLAGVGTVTGVVNVAEGAILVPGGTNAIGILTMASSVTNNGVLAVDLNEGGSGDLLKVNGDLVLGPSAALNATGSFGAGRDYIIAQTTNGVVSGQFAVHNLTNSWQVVYQAQSVIIKGPAIGTVIRVR